MKHSDDHGIALLKASDTLRGQRLPFPADADVQLQGDGIYLMRLSFPGVRRQLCHTSQDVRKGCQAGIPTYVTYVFVAKCLQNTMCSYKRGGFFVIIVIFLIWAGL